MATKIVTSTITNLTEYPNSFKRQGAFPLERYSLFNTLAAAQEYASSNPIAYVGQIVVVVTDTTVKTYIIGLDSGLYEIAQGTSNVDGIQSKVAAAAAVQIPDRASVTLYKVYDMCKAVIDAFKDPVS